MDIYIDHENKNARLIRAVQEVMANEVKILPISAENLPVELAPTQEGIAQRLAYLKEKAGKELPYLTGEKQFTEAESLAGNIENYIGMACIPTGVIGPIRVYGTDAKGDFYVPLATTEGALVASYHRGAKACYLAGGVVSVCLEEGVQRAPIFKFESISDLGTFMMWVLPQVEKFKDIVAQKSRFAKLIDLKATIEGNHLILSFEYQTGDAAGQNMVTLCTDLICKYLIENAPIKPVYWFIEGNYSGDKKATALSFTNVRGKKVTTEITLTKEIVQKVLKTTSETITNYWRSSTMGVVQSGAVGAQGHYANGLTALFIATGQDVACIAEAATGITRMEETKDGGLYVSVTLPSLVVGTVGGGTSLPTQRECLELLDCYGAGKARKFAEICGAVVIAGEISIAAAIAAGHFSSAHEKFGRKK
jgi:hydroxymethylglutaryl-CoA reductase (NADPH)